MGSILKAKRNFKFCHEKKAIYDYGKLYKSRDDFQSFRPQSIEEAIEFMQIANQENWLLRFRGSGHTFNGVTMPEPNEVLVYTDGIDHYRFEEDGTLTTGAGAMVWDVRDLARDHGHDLKVFNGGWAGPSVGGYINAGGFGKGNLSKINGGLWESINSITIIDAQGKLQKIDRKDQIFPWIFGSYGQLGFIVEANFQLEKKNAAYFFFQNIEIQNFELPLGTEGKIPKRQVDDPAENLISPETSDPNILFWFSMLIDREQEEQAWIDLEKWVDKNSDVIKPEGGWHGPKKNGQPIGYHYVIKYKKFHPPLIYSKAKDFLVIGIMSRLNVNQNGAVDRIFKVENEFIELAKKGNYRLYLQAENFGRNIDFEAYYGTKIYHQFLDIKNRFDPDHRINKNIFFKQKNSKKFGHSNLSFGH